MTSSGRNSQRNLPLPVESGPTFGYVLTSEQFRAPDLVKFGVAAEKAAFDAIWSSDHFQPWQDNQGHATFAWATLAALGQRTERAILGTGVTCPSYRYHPSVVAEGFATLNELTPGRVFLGVGSGEALNEQAATGAWDQYEERAERLIESVQVIRALWSGEMVNHEGRFYKVNGKLYDAPENPIPIYIAAAAEHSMHLAGQYGDGLISDSETPLKPEMKKAFEEGARAAGKNPKTLPVIAETWVIAGTEDEARRYARLWNFLPNAWTEFVDNPDPRDIERRAAEEIALEKVLQKWIVSDDPNVHIERLQKLLDGGITTLFIHSPQEDQLSFIDWYSKRILPELKSYKR